MILYGLQSKLLQIIATRPKVQRAHKHCTVKSKVVLKLSALIRRADMMCLGVCLVFEMASKTWSPDVYKKSL